MWSRIERQTRNFRSPSRTLAQASARLPEVYLEDLCFQAQQAAEKAIKAVFIARKTPFPYVHDLARLLTLEESGRRSRTQ